MSVIICLQRLTCAINIRGKAVVITDIDGKENEVIPTKNGNFANRGTFDICVMKLPEDIAMAIAANVKCATFEGSGYPCEIDGFRQMQSIINLG